MKIFKALMIFAMAGFLLCSCEYEWIQPEKAPIPDNVSFSADVMPIFNNSCNSEACHAPGGDDPDLTEANAYDELISGGYVNTDTPAASLIYTSITTGSMRFEVDNSADPDMILAWIQQGAQNN